MSTKADSAIVLSPTPARQLSCFRLSHLGLFLFIYIKQFIRPINNEARLHVMAKSIVLLPIPIEPDWRARP